jgi:hypothetical protein
MSTIWPLPSSPNCKPTTAVWPAGNTEDWPVVSVDDETMGAAEVGAIPGAGAGETVLDGAIELMSSWGLTNPAIVSMTTRNPTDSPLLLPSGQTSDLPVYCSEEVRSG